MRHYYTQEECDFLEANISGHSYGELRNAFNAKFNCSVTKNAIEHKCKKLNIDHGHSGVVLKTGESNQFSQTRQIGSEMVCAGKVYVKTNCNYVPKGNSRFGDNGNWVQKNRYVYEQTHGKIPDGYQLVALDGNRNNFDPSNFYAVPRKIGMILGVNKWFFADRDATLAAIKWCELFYAMKEGGEHVEIR